jgi:hypothetical protein
MFLDSEPSFVDGSRLSDNSGLCSGNDLCFSEDIVNAAERSAGNEEAAASFRESFELQNGLSQKRVPIGDGDASIVAANVERRTSGQSYHSNVGPYRRLLHKSYERTLFGSRYDDQYYKRSAGSFCVTKGAFATVFYTASYARQVGVEAWERYRAEYIGLVIW